MINLKGTKVSIILFISFNYKKIINNLYSFKNQFLL